VKILVTGSEGTLGRPLVSQLSGNGHEVHGIDLDHSGTNTRGTIATLRREGIDGAVAVSSPYHLPRIADEARRQGVALTTSAAPKTGGRSRYLRHALREVAASWWYAIRPPRARARRPC